MMRILTVPKITLVLFIGISILVFMYAKEIETEKMLSLFLPIVWSVLTALGGAIIFISKVDFETGKMKLYKETAKSVRKFSLCLICATLVSLFLAAIFPLRNDIKTAFVEYNSLRVYSLFSSIYDALEFSLIIVPSFGALVVGAFCLFVAVNNGDA